MTDEASHHQLHLHQLREKAARGDALTPDEQTELIAWYVQQDPETAPSPKPASLWEALGKELETASARLQDAAQQFQAKADEFEDLRRDVAVLSEQIPKPPKTPKKH